MSSNINLIRYRPDGNAVGLQFIISDKSDGDVFRRIGDVVDKAFSDYEEEYGVKLLDTDPGGSNLLESIVIAK